MSYPSLTCIPANCNCELKIDDKNTIMCLNELPFKDRVVQVANSNHYESERTINGME
jgi:hypothetical protein